MYDLGVRTWLIALVVVGCGSGADTRVAPSGTPPELAGAGAPVPPHDAAIEPATEPTVDASPPHDAAVAIDASAARTGGWASLAGTGAISSGFTTPDGAACDGYELHGRQVSWDCDSGVCEGVGCPGERLGSMGFNRVTPTGYCVMARRRCVKDRIAYCGCDGKTFYASSTCPKRRFVSVGECPRP